MRAERFFNLFLFKLVWCALALVLLWRMVPEIQQLNPLNLARGMTTSMELMQIEEALESYRHLNERYPEDFGKFLAENFKSNLKDVTVDSWNTPYRLATQGDRYVIRSAGSDRLFYTGDDHYLYHADQPGGEGRAQRVAVV